MGLSSPMYSSRGRTPAAAMHCVRSTSNAQSVRLRQKFHRKKSNVATSTPAAKVFIRSFPAQTLAVFVRTCRGGTSYDAAPKRSRRQAHARRRVSFRAVVTNLLVWNATPIKLSVLLLSTTVPWVYNPRRTNRKIQNTEPCLL